jgi:hypothetical protein
VAAGPAFFVSAWLLMIFPGIAGAEVGIRPFGYLTSMVDRPHRQAREGLTARGGARDRGQDQDGPAAQARERWLSPTAAWSRAARM